MQKHAPTIKCHQHVASHNADDGATGEDLYALFLRFAVISTHFRFTCEEKPHNDVTYLHLLPLPYHLLQLTGFSHIHFQAWLLPQTLLRQVRVWVQMIPHMQFPWRTKVQIDLSALTSRYSYNK